MKFKNGSGISKQIIIQATLFYFIYMQGHFLEVSFIVYKVYSPTEVYVNKLYHPDLFSAVVHKKKNICAGTDISTSPLAPANEFLNKGLSGKYILVFTCPNGQADFLNTKNIFFI